MIQKQAVTKADIWGLLYGYATAFLTSWQGQNSQACRKESFLAMQIIAGTLLQAL
jgi:hypothetical protein